MDNPKGIETPPDWGDVRSHDYANIFPLIPVDDLKLTLRTIWTHGYSNNFPIVLFEGQILDGRNRWRAAIEAKCVPSFVEFTGSREDALAFAIQANLDRRQLNDAQRAMVAAKIEPLFAAAAKERQRAAGGDKKSEAAKSVMAESPEPIDTAPTQPAPTARDQAAAALNVSPTTTGRAKTLRSQAPDLAEKVEAGKMGVWQADALLRERQGKPKRRGDRSKKAPPAEATTNPAEETEWQHIKRIAREQDARIARQREADKRGVKAPPPDDPAGLALIFRSNVDAYRNRLQNEFEEELTLAILRELFQARPDLLGKLGLEPKAAPTVNANGEQL